MKNLRMPWLTIEMRKPMQSRCLNGCHAEGFTLDALEKRYNARKRTEGTVFPFRLLVRVEAFPAVIPSGSGHTFRQWELASVPSALSS